MAKIGYEMTPAENCHLEDLRSPQPDRRNGNGRNNGNGRDCIEIPPQLVAPLPGQRLLLEDLRQ